MGKGKFSEALHPRGKDGKFTSGGGSGSGGGGKGGSSRRERIGVAIGGKIADQRVKTHTKLAKQHRAAAKQRTALDAQYTAETGDKGGPRDAARLAARNQKNLTKAKAHSAKARSIQAKRKGGK